MIRVEFHCHSKYSRDCLTHPESILKACRKKGIDRVVITDHNTIHGAEICKQLVPQRVFVGEEIETLHGELLALFVKEHVPPGLPALETITRLRQQGAFISIAHPFDWARSGHWQTESLKKIVNLVDAVETFNARSITPGANHEAQAFAQKLNLPEIAGSDAHTAGEIGRATLLLPEFHDAESLRHALTQAKPVLTPSPLWIHLSSRYAVMYKKIKGWFRNS